jgi:hypothetical protein
LGRYFGIGNNLELYKFWLVVKIWQTCAFVTSMVEGSGSFWDCGVWTKIQAAIKKQEGTTYVCQIISFSLLLFVYLITVLPD